ncbi:MAG: ATP-dependent helicase [Bacteroidota bacterium]
MNIIAFEGAAGTGKTTQLMAQLEAQLITTELRDGQRVLGLTFMHGARRRLNARMSHVPGLKGRFECVTFDSFAWNLVQRWRSLVKVLNLLIDNNNEYNTTCSVAALLLEKPEVRNWVARTFPIVVVDEVQDCKQGRLGIIQSLAQVVILLVAGDEFQDLSDLGPNPALEWLKSTCKVIHLNINHRTNKSELLNASMALRQGNPLYSVGDFQILAAYRALDAAGHVARSLKWKPGGDVVLLSPTKPANSAFVLQTLERLDREPIKIKEGQYAGPFKIRWELDITTMELQLFQAVGLIGEPDQIVDLNNLNFNVACPGAAELREWLHRRYSLGYVQPLKLGDIQSQAKRIVQRIRAYGSVSHGLRAMTIQQAKNQEFRGVIVLWPYEVGGSIESQRRRLYNAVTRAREWVTVIVQDPYKRRITQPPFC